MDRWECDPRKIHCPHGHPFIVPRSNGRLTYRVDGHIFLECARCRPTLYAFGIITTRPSPIVMLYRIREDQARALKDLPEDLTSLEILTFLGYGTREDAA